MTSMEGPFRIAVLCTGNSARSQIGEALIATRGATRPAGRIEAVSAGSRPAPRVNAYAIEILAAHGIAWGDGAPKHVDAILDTPIHLAITVCDHARDACPYLPGVAARVHWGLPDPADHAEPASAREAFAATFAALSARIAALLALPLETMTPEGLVVAAEQIHSERS
jgi:arsenate reductase